VSANSIRVDDTTLSRAVRAGDREGGFLEIDIEVSDAAHFLDMSRF